MNRQQSMKKCAAIKRALPVWGAPEGRVHGPHDPRGRCQVNRSPEFAAQWAEAERTRRVS